MKAFSIITVLGYLAYFIVLCITCTQTPVSALTIASLSLFAYIFAVLM